MTEPLRRGAQIAAAVSPANHTRVGPTDAQRPSQRPWSRRLPAVGDRVRIERDETRWPPRGTWRHYRGKIGTVVEINRDRRPERTEYGVAFGKRPRTDAWFLRHELTPTERTR